MAATNEPFYKVLITTAGVGQPLGNLTKFTNKSLIRVGKKPALSYIIEAYPPKVPLVITVGYYGEHIREFVQLAYPDRQVTFINIDNYDGPGASLAYSMLQARQELLCPFIYHAGDTIATKDVIPAPASNWLAYFVSNDTSQYASLQTLGTKLLDINQKGATDSNQVHVGLVGIQDYASFWNELQTAYEENQSDAGLNDCSAINRMLGKNFPFAAWPLMEWFDIGNTTSLERARESITDSFHLLDKEDESIFIFPKFVIKFFSDKKTVAHRTQRAHILHGLVPRLEGSTDNFYRYEYAVGDLYSRVVTPKDFYQFLHWLKDNLWREEIEVPPEVFKQQNCLLFYKQKTIQRVNQLLKKTNLHDNTSIINGEEIPVVTELLSKVDWLWLANADQHRIHGDLILDNIIKTKDGYCLLDWRQDFGGLLKAGDRYYDLAKLNHNLTVNHDIVSAGYYTVDIDHDAVRCDIHRSDNLLACQEKLFTFLTEEGLDPARVKLITSLIWLNSSPLHNHPYDLFLFFFGRLNLWRALQKLPSSFSTSTASSQRASFYTPEQENTPKFSVPMTPMA